MFKFFGIIFVLTAYVCGQSVVNRVFLLNHRGYMIDVIQRVVHTVDQRGWSNLKLPDIKNDIDESLALNRTFKGTVTYKNGFLVSIQHLGITNCSLSQRWNVTEGAVRVYVQGQLRMTDVTLGYDIEADLEHGIHHYTGAITLPLLTYDISVVRIAKTHQMSVIVYGNMLHSNSIEVDIMPRDLTAGVLSSVFNSRHCEAGIRSWEEILKPIVEDVVNNHVPFPNMCYNCPTQANC